MAGLSPAISVALFVVGEGRDGGEAAKRRCSGLGVAGRDRSARRAVTLVRGKNVRQARTPENLDKAQSAD